MEPKPDTLNSKTETRHAAAMIVYLPAASSEGFGLSRSPLQVGSSSSIVLPWDPLNLIGVIKAPKKYISKSKDRDIPYKPPYNEAQQARDIPIKCFCLCAFWVPNSLFLGLGDSTAVRFFEDVFLHFASPAIEPHFKDHENYFMVGIGQKMYSLIPYWVSSTHKNLKCYPTMTKRRGPKDSIRRKP